MKLRPASMLPCILTLSLLSSQVLTAAHNTDPSYDEGLLEIHPLDDLPESKNLIKAFVQETKLFSYLQNEDLSHSSLCHSREMAWVRQRHEQHLPASVDEYPPIPEGPILRFKQLNGWSLTTSTDIGVNFSFVGCKKNKEYFQDFFLYLPDVKEPLILEVTALLKKQNFGSYKLTSVSAKLTRNATDGCAEQQNDSSSSSGMLDVIRYDPNHTY